LDNHVKDLVAIDFFTVPTATFGVLFGFLVLAHDRRRVLHFNVTASPSAEWTARQVVQAFPEETAPRYLVRDRDRIYGSRFRRMLEILDVEEVVTAARSPWQNAYAERLSGSLRREMPGSRRRPWRDPSPPDPGWVLRVLQPDALPPLASWRRAGIQTGARTRTRPGG